MSIDNQDLFGYKNVSLEEVEKLADDEEHQRW